MQLFSIKNGLILSIVLLSLACQTQEKNMIVPEKETGDTVIVIGDDEKEEPAIIFNPLDLATYGAQEHKFLRFKTSGNNGGVLEQDDITFSYNDNGLPILTERKKEGLLFDLKYRLSSTSTFTYDDKKTKEVNISDIMYLDDNLALEEESNIQFKYDANGNKTQLILDKKEKFIHDRPFNITTTIELTYNENGYPSSEKIISQFLEENEKDETTNSEVSYTYELDAQSRILSQNRHVIEKTTGKYLSGNKDTYESEEEYSEIKTYQYEGKNLISFHEVKKISSSSNARANTGSIEKISPYTQLFKINKSGAKSRKMTEEAPKDGMYFTFSDFEDKSNIDLMLYTLIGRMDYTLYNIPVSNYKLSEENEYGIVHLRQFTNYYNGLGLQEKGEFKVYSDGELFFEGVANYTYSQD